MHVLKTLLKKVLYRFDDEIKTSRTRKQE